MRPAVPSDHGERSAHRLAARLRPRAALAGRARPAGAPEEVWAATRARVATEGFGAAAAGAPGRRTASGPAGPSSRATSSSTVRRRPTGAGSRGRRRPGRSTACASGGWTRPCWPARPRRLAANSRWEYDDLPYWGGEVDCCINALTLANGAWLGADVSALAGGSSSTGWPTVAGTASGSRARPARRSTPRSTRSRACSPTSRHRRRRRALARRAAAAEEYLLERRLMYRLSTGELVGPWVTRFAYPFRWLYSVLNAADHFRAASLLRRHRPGPPDGRRDRGDPRARQPDGTWLQERRHPGRVWFEIDVPAGEPSKWLTLSGARGCCAGGTPPGRR